MIFSVGAAAQAFCVAASQVAGLFSSSSANTLNSKPPIEVDLSALTRQGVLVASPLQPRASVLRSAFSSFSLPQTRGAVLSSKLTAGALTMMAPVLSGFDGTIAFWPTVGLLTAAAVVFEGAVGLIQGFQRGRLIREHFPKEAELYWTKGADNEWVSRPNVETEVLRNAVSLVERVLKMSPEKRRTEIDRLVSRWDILYYRGESTYRFHLENAHLILALRRLSEVVPESFDHVHLRSFQQELVATWQRYTDWIKPIVANLERAMGSQPRAIE